MREELREQALRVLPDDIDFGDTEEDANAYEENVPQNEAYNNLRSTGLNNPMSSKGRNATKNPYPIAGGERLNTIEEEEKQFDTTSNIYKTNERHHQNSSGVLANHHSNTMSKNMSSAEGAKKSADSRKRLDDESDISPRDDIQKLKSNQSSIDEEIEDEYPDQDHDQIPTELSQ